MRTMYLTTLHAYSTVVGKQRILFMTGSEGFDEVMKAKMVEVLKEDEREVWVKKLKLKGDMKEEKQKRQQVL